MIPVRVLFVGDESECRYSQSIRMAAVPSPGDVVGFSDGPKRVPYGYKVVHVFWEEDTITLDYVPIIVLS